MAVAKKKKEPGASFFKELKEEMKRVSWTTKQELYTCTKIVVTAIFSLGLGIYVIDLLIRLILNALGSLARLLGS